VQRQGAYAPVLHSQPPTPAMIWCCRSICPTQQAAEDGLGDHRGAVVAIDPNNGDVLALASKPGFDPTEFARGISRSEYAAPVRQ
jgi:penicillin-binding protein 2